MANDPKLTALEEVKLDAEFAFLQREKERKDREDFEAKKAALKQPSEANKSK